MCNESARDSVREHKSVEDNVWLASAVTVLKGVNIKRGSVIECESSMVNKSTEENGVYVGIPAKLLKNRK